MAKQMKTSWESSAKWYDKAVGEKGHYYHENVIFPKLLKLMDLESGGSHKVLDLACGQGILSRKIPKKSFYTGMDISKSLIKEAKIRNKRSGTEFSIGDITKKWKINHRDFTHGCILLALQNVQNPLAVLKNAFDHLVDGGKFYIVINHPCFRIPRMSHWGIDEKQQLQYRRLDVYLSDQKIPIQTHPGQGKSSAKTWSFHHPLSSYVGWLKEAGFCITQLQEWVSDKKSTGTKAKMEDKARKEFPLFLAIEAQKIAVS